MCAFSKFIPGGAPDRVDTVTYMSRPPDTRWTKNITIYSFRPLVSMPTCLAESMPGEQEPRPHEETILDGGG